MRQFTLASLFDGIGGFPYAASFYNIASLWASEIIPACVSVTKKHFPDMAHAGDITQLHGGKLPPVDIVTFGSPCQGLSLAGQRRGLADERSGLFMEAIRIIDEMREATHGRYPKFALFENVPGALSSAGGRDFAAVLQSFTKAQIPIPRSGKWANAGMVRGGGVDLAWCVYDAQYFGTAQRRRRLFLVCDFTGRCAGEILFVPKSLRGYFEAGGTPRQGLAAFTENGAGTAKPAIAVLNDQGGDSLNVEKNGISPTLRSQSHGNQPITAYALQGSMIGRADENGQCDGINENVSSTLNIIDRHAICMATGQANAGIMEDAAPTLTAAHEQPILVHPQISGTLCASGAGLSRPAGQGNELDFCVFSAGFQYKASSRSGSVGYQEETAPTLLAGQQSGAMKAYVIGSYHSEAMLSENPKSGFYEADTSRTLDLNGENPACQQGGLAIVKGNDACTDWRTTVRRLTPTECERLQGYPDGWTEYGADGMPISDTKRYQMLGNSVAVPCVAYIMQGIVRVLNGGEPCSR